MTNPSIAKPIAVATLISGTLDILLAMILTVWFGREIPAMLRSVASGPIPSATEMGSSGAILGLVVHFTLMAVMATIFALGNVFFGHFEERTPKWRRASRPAPMIMC